MSDEAGAPEEPEISEEQMQDFQRQHFIETIAQRVTDEIVGPVSLVERATVGRLLHLAFQSMELKEFADAAFLYKDWKLFQLLLPPDA